MFEPVNSRPDFIGLEYEMMKFWDKESIVEKYLNKIYENEYCFSPITSLSVHCTNINSSYGIAPYINIKKLWDQNIT